mmetsp:Transcript_50002/g.56626  ORF Transcript_50002/g.56626 Transcript_50002/m.56626 type:complete len:126 (-) Transcript_50002:9-386(-)
MNLHPTRWFARLSTRSQSSSVPIEDDIHEIYKSTSNGKGVLNNSQIAPSTDLLLRVGQWMAFPNWFPTTAVLHPTYPVPPRKMFMREVMYVTNKTHIDRDLRTFAEKRCFATNSYHLVTYQYHHQ